MKLPGLFALLAVTMVFSGCATPLQYFNATPHAGQKSVAVLPARTIFGVQEIREGIHSEVLFEPTGGNKLFNGTAVFWIFVKNISHRPIHFSAADIRVVDKNGREVPLLPLGHLVQKIQANKSKQEWGYLIISSMASALAAAPYMTTQQTGTYNGYTSNGQHVTGTYVGTQQNPTVAYMAQRENDARISGFNTQMEEAYRRAMANVERLSLKAVAIDQGQKIEGIVTVQLPSGYSLPNRYRFIVTIDGTAFEYDFPISNRSE